MDFAPNALEIPPAATLWFDPTTGEQPMHLSPYARAVERAVAIAGGVNELAIHLGVSRVLLQACIAGSHETPTIVFLKAVDYLMAHLFSPAYWPPGQGRAAPAQVEAKPKDTGSTIAY